MQFWVKNYVFTKWLGKNEQMLESDSNSWSMVPDTLTTELGMMVFKQIYWLQINKTFQLPSSDVRTVIKRSEVPLLNFILHLW